jgi:hypothetical protein
LAANRHDCKASMELAARERFGLRPVFRRLVWSADVC